MIFMLSKVPLPDPAVPEAAIPAEEAPAAAYLGF